MPATTPGRGYPYPVETDLINVPGDIERLARAIDTVDTVETLRRFNSIAQRNAAVPVPSEGQRCMVILAPGTGQSLQFVGRGGIWSPLGAMVVATKASTQTITADSTWQLCSFTTLYWNVLSAYNGSTWTAPFRGMIRVTTGVTFIISSTTFPTGHIGGHHVALGLGYLTTVLQGDSFFGQFAITGLKASMTLNVNAGDPVSAQVWANAIGFSKSVHGVGNIDNTGFYIEYI